MIEQEEAHSDLNKGKGIDTYLACNQANVDKVTTAKIQTINKIVSKKSKKKHPSFKIIINIGVHIFLGHRNYYHVQMKILWVIHHTPQTRYTAEKLYGKEKKKRSISEEENKQETGDVSGQKKREWQKP